MQLNVSINKPIKIIASLESMYITYIYCESIKLRAEKSSPKRFIGAFYLQSEGTLYSVHNPDCLPTWLAKDFWMAAANSGFFERPVKFLSPLKRLLVSTRLFMYVRMLCSVTDPGCLSRIPDPGSKISNKGEG